MVAEKVVIILSGGAPWGFRLQGGDEHKKPIQVAKVRKRSRACRAGLCEGDEVVAINEQRCMGLSHAQAMNMIDSCPGSLNITIKRVPFGKHSTVLPSCSALPRTNGERQSGEQALSSSVTKPPQPPTSNSVHHGLLVPDPSFADTWVKREYLTSPPDSEGYYAETDSDADTFHQRHQRPKRRSPNGKASPAQVNGGHLPGVARREVVYCPPPSEWSLKAVNGVENASTRAGEGKSPEWPRNNEADSSVQEPANMVPLVSPKRAQEALQLASARKLVPMVGPVDNPVDEELTITYADKAKQAKLHRGESVQEKQVKEARSKCRSIASLLTDAPNPHSKGVLMFKKRRQRAKKYTLTCFGSVNGELQPSENEDEEDGFMPGSESEVDEDGFTSAPESGWDSDYMDVLERRTPAAVEVDDLGLNDASGKGARLFEQQRRRAQNATTQVVMSEKQLSPVISVNCVTPIGVTPSTCMNYSSMNGHYDCVTKTSPSPVSTLPVLMNVQANVVPLDSAQLSEDTSSSVLNRTARPFATGFINHRSATAPVVFRPSSSKKPSSQPTTEVVTIAPPATCGLPSTGVKHTVSVSSLYIPAKSASYNTSSISAATFSPPGAPFSPVSTTSASFPPTPMPYSAYIQPSVHFNPTTTANLPAAPCPPSFQSSIPFTPPAMSTTPLTSTTIQNTSHFKPTMPTIPYTPEMANTQQTLSAVPYCKPTVPSETYLSPQSSYTANGSFVNGPQNSQKVSFSPFITVATATSAPATTSHVQIQPQVTSNELLASREQRISVPAARTGILQEARCRGSRKPMFTLPEEKKVNSPNPDLLSMVQNLDERPKPEAGFESGPEEDHFNLGAEACNFMQAHKHKRPPPVAPKPQPVSDNPQIPSMGGKGAELFARRQNRMDRYTLDSAAPLMGQAISLREPHIPSSTASVAGHWKYSPNIRAPPPISYNPLLSPSCPPTALRGTKTAENVVKKGVSQKKSIKALDIMNHQPYQLNSSLFTYGNGASIQPQRRHSVGSTLTTPKQVPVKAARVYEVKRFSTPTPMSAPNSLSPTVITPRSATSLGERLWHSDEDPVPLPTPVSIQNTLDFHCAAPMPSQNTVNFSSFGPVPNPASTLPELPKISATPIQNHFISPPAVAPSNHQTGMYFKSAPDLSPWAFSSLQSPVSESSANIRVPRPNFSTSRAGIKANVWRPGNIHY